MPKVLIPTALKGFAGGQDEIQSTGTTVGEVMDAVTAQYPELRKHLFDTAGNMRSYVNVYLNDEDIRGLQKTDTPVKETDELTVVPSIAGGADARSEIFSPGRLAHLEELTGDETMRYSRHLIMPEVGLSGQRKLKSASVLCIGTGGLGAPLALYLAAAGIGRLGLVDFDTVDYTNLHRQVIHFTGDVGKPKLKSAAEKIHRSIRMFTWSFTRRCSLRRTRWRSSGPTM